MLQFFLFDVANSRVRKGKINCLVKLYKEERKLLRRPSVVVSEIFFACFSWFSKVFMVRLSARHKK